MARHREVPKPRNQIPVPAPALTEALILEMGDDHYMGAEQKQFFRARLIASETELQNRTRQAANEIATVTAGADPVDRASAEEEHQLAIGARARDAVRMVEIQAALRRISTDEFGWCLETGEMIGVSRLLIHPTTTLCVEAQQRSENKTTRYRA